MWYDQMISTFHVLKSSEIPEDFGSEQVEHPIQIWWVDVANAWEPTQREEENHRLKLVPLKGRICDRSLECTHQKLQI